MRLRVVVALAAAGALLAPTAASSQSVVELAAKEKARRKKSAEPAKTYTEWDLTQRGRPSGSFPRTDPDAAATTAASEPAEAPDPEQEQRAKEQENWRQRLEETEAYRGRVASQITEIEASLRNLSNNLYGSARNNRIAALEDAKRELEATDRQIEELRQEGIRKRYN